MLLALVGVVFSCQKEVITQEKQSDENENITGPSSDIAKKAGGLRILVEIKNAETGESHGLTCLSSGGNCGPTIEVTGGSLPVILDYIYLAADNNNNTAIVNLFNTNQTALGNIFSSATINDVINGDLIVTKHPDANGDPIVYLLFTEVLTGVVAYAQPINL